MSRDFDYNLIRIFVSVIEHKSMGKAADTLDIGGSTVSYAINKLRDYYGDPLFVRVKNGIRPTSLALNLYAFFKAAEEDIASGLNLKRSLSLKTEKPRYIHIRANNMVEYWLAHYAFEEKVISTQTLLEFCHQIPTL